MIQEAKICWNHPHFVRCNSFTRKGKILFLILITNLCMNCLFSNFLFYSICFLTWFERDMWSLYLFTCILWFFFCKLEFESAPVNISMIEKKNFYKHLPDFQLVLCVMKRIKEEFTYFVWVLNLKDKLSHDKNLCLMNQSLLIHHATSKIHDFFFL